MTSGAMNRWIAPLALEDRPLFLASPARVLERSGGEVKKPETLNYRTFRPERGGLFDAEIFGELFACGCADGAHTVKDEKQRCSECGALVRRAEPGKPGHIVLAREILHPLLRGYARERTKWSERDLERVLSCEVFVRDDGSFTEEHELEADATYFVGASAVRALGSFEVDPVLTVIPVLAAALRPLVPLEGGRFATSDLNDLYRRVINRSNRLARLIELSAPDIIIRNERRALQEAVDALFHNAGPKVITGPDRRPLRSLLHLAKGTHAEAMLEAMLLVSEDGDVADQL